jgi:Choline/ethanolamine kinase
MRCACVVIDRLNELGLTKKHLTFEVQHLESILVSLDSPVVFCHNDLIPKNIIYDEHERKLPGEIMSISLRLTVQALSCNYEM